MKVKVTVKPRQSILDPQGVAVRDAIRHHGIASVESVRIGKIIDLEFNDAVPRGEIEGICHELLSNPVIEDYQLEIEE